MKKTHLKPNILLIRPPFSLPGDLPENWTSMISVLEGLPINLHINDAALDFFERVLIRGDHMPSDAGLIARAGIRAVSTDHGGYDGLLRDSASLNQVLASACDTFAPCRFHRYGFAHNGLKGVADLVRFAGDPVSNPFRPYAHHLWQPFAESAPPDLALLCVERPGQMGPAATFGFAWRERWPQIPLKMMAPVSVADLMRQAPLVHGPGGRPFEIMNNMAQLREAIADVFSVDCNTDGTGLDPSSWFEASTGAPLVAERISKMVRLALDKGAPLIVWRDCGDKIGPVSDQLYAASRQGIWNHLILREDSPDDLRQFAAANANIVHSYCHEERRPSVFSDSSFRFPSDTPPYGHTSPMPGKPLWMELKDPDAIAKVLAHDDLKTLIRLRVRSDGQSVFEVGRHLSYHFERPDALPSGHLDEIVRMVEAGGSVNTQFVRHNLERAYLIAYVEEEGVIIGNSSLKHPREEYIDAVSRQSGIDLHHFLERGYTSVRPEYRGLGVGVKLLEGLTQRAGDHKIFSVIAESNVATQKMAMRNRTRRVATFFSQRAEKEMSVWIPEWMLPEGVELPLQPALDIGQDSGKDNP